jgi:hypothetical protein
MLNFFKTKTFKVASFVIAFAVMFTLTASAYTFSGPTLKKGMKGGEVAELQTLVGAIADGNFGPATHAKVATWQAANGLTVDGVFGKMSMAKANGGSVSTGGTVALCPNGMTLASNCATAPGTTGGTTGGTLTGGAGSVEDYSLTSGLNNEEVGEDKSNVKVVGLEVEADDSSDLKVTAMKLVFDEGTGATADFEDYADEVSIWMGSTEIARVDGNTFTDDNNWTKTVSFTKDAIIKAGKMETFYVAISGVSNLDSNDEGDEWNLDITSVRFMDGQGAVTSEDPLVAATTFSFETLATASNLEFKVSQGKDEDTVNDAHVINVHATDDTDDVSILSFNVEIEGSEDVVVDSLPVNIDVSATHVDDMITGLTLWMDGKEVGSASASSDCEDDSDCADVGADETYLFDNLDLTLDGGKDYEFLVKVDLLSIADDLNAGHTISANIGEALLEAGANNFDGEVDGTDLVAGDITGTVAGSASEVRDIGVNVKLVSVNQVVSHTGDIVGSGAGDDDQGTFTITFDVTAFDGNVYIDGTSPDLSGSSAGVGTEADLDLTTTGTAALTSATITSPTGATMTGTANADARFLVSEDETERFTITAVSTVSVDGFVKISLTELLYALTDVDGDLGYAFNLTDFKTGDLYMNAN